jgi:hypothetical protein
MRFSETHLETPDFQQVNTPQVQADTGLLVVIA